MFQLLIADDHPITRQGIKFNLREHISGLQFHEAGDGDEALEVLGKHLIELVLLDLNMPGTDPQQLLQLMHINWPALRIIIFSTNNEAVYGKAFMQLGAMGYIRKDAPPAELVGAVQSVMAGKPYIPKHTRNPYQQDDRGSKAKQDNNPFSTLTNKELEVLRHLAAGTSLTATAGIMNLALSTVGTHKANLFAKLRVNNILELKTLVDLYGLF